MGNSTVLQFNTIVLYAVLIALAGALIYLIARTQIKKYKYAKEGAHIRENGMSESEKSEAIEQVLKAHPYLSGGVVWLNEQLLLSRRAKTVVVTLAQEWCCEDKKGTQPVPARCRPAVMTFAADGETHQLRLEGYAPEEYLTEAESRLMGWCLMKQCRMLIPFKQYNLRVKRITRKFFVENDVPVKWKKKTVTMETYMVEIL